MTFLTVEQRIALRESLVKAIPASSLSMLLQDARLPIAQFDDSGTLEVRFDGAIRLAERHGADAFRRFLKGSISMAPGLLEQEELRPIFLRWGLFPTPTPASRPTPAPVPPTPSARKEEPPVSVGAQLSWLQLSDLHFGQDEEHSKSRFEQQIVVERLLDDVAELRQRLGAPDFILLTGDVAFSASPEQYGQAGRYLERLCEEAGVSRSQVFCVPGNHDVDQKYVASNYMSKIVHRDLRAKPSRIDDLLSNPMSLETAVFPKLQAYAHAMNGFGAPTLSAEMPFYAVDLPGPMQRPLRVVGLNTCLLSYDKEDAPSNLALGAGQLYQLFTRVPKDTLLLVLMHHPPVWLTDGDELLKSLQRHPHVLFSGHVHRSRGRIEQAFHQNGLLHFSAGAACASASELKSHAYAWGRLGTRGLEYYPRYYSELRGEFRANHEFNLLKGFEHVEVRRERLPENLERYLS